MSGGGGGGRGPAAGPVPASARKLVQGLKEIVSRSDAEIYAALRDCGMDPDEAVSRLLSQGPICSAAPRSPSFRAPLNVLAQVLAALVSLWSVFVANGLKQTCQFHSTSGIYADMESPVPGCFLCRDFLLRLLGLLCSLTWRCLR